MDTNPINTRNRKRRNAEGSHIDFRVLEELLVAENRLQAGDNQLLFCPEKAELHRSGRNSAKAPDRPTLPRTMLFSSYSNSVLQATSFADLGLVAQDLQHIFSPGKGNGAWWLDVQNPSEKTVRQLCASFGVHHLTVEDIVTGECGEKIEDFSLYYFTCIRSFQAMEVESHVEYEPYNVYMVVFEEGTLSFSFTQSDHSAHICDRIEVLKDYVQITSDWFFYALIDDIVDSFAPSISRIEKIVNEIDDQVYTTRLDDMQAFLSTIEEARHEVLSLIRLLSGKTAILRRFNNHQNGGSNAGEELDEKSVKRGTERQSLQGNDIRLYIDDVQDHVSTMLSSLNQFEGLLSRSQNNYVAQLSIDNLEGRRKVNDFMGKIALVTVILTLLNFISGLFGQNVNANIVFYVDNNSYLPFALILSGEAIVAGTVLYGARSYRLF